MKALTWQGNHDVRVEGVPDPRIERGTDAIIKVTSSGLRELLEGLHDGGVLETPPLDPATSGPMRVREFTTGVGATDTP